MKKLLLSLGLIAASTATFATTYQVHNKPNSKAHVVGEISGTNQGQYIQFFQKGDWVKVADTNTGKVGWVNTQQAQMAEQKAQYQQALNNLKMQHQQLNAQKQAFEQRYQQAVQNIEQQTQALQQQIQHSIANQQAQLNQRPQQTQAVPAQASNQTQTPMHQQMKRSFNAVSVKTNADDKTATVTKEWLGKDGKMHKTTKQIPVSELQNMQLGI